MFQLFHKPSFYIYYSTLCLTYHQTFLIYILFSHMSRQIYIQISHFFQFILQNYIQMLSSLKLQRNTTLGREELKKVKTIWQSLYDNNESFDFRNPVDWKAMGLTDYGFIIKHPMDLNTVNRKLREEKYQFVQEVLDDIQLIWDNCKTYNQSGSWIYNIAEKLQRSFKKMVKNYLPNIPITIPNRANNTGRPDQKTNNQGLIFEEDDYEEVSYNEKLKFSQKLKHLSPQDLGAVVQKIMEKSPNAFKQSDGDKAQILVDNIQGTFFRQLIEDIDQMNLDYEQKVSKRIKHSHE